MTIMEKLHSEVEKWETSLKLRIGAKNAARIDMTIMQSDFQKELKMKRRELKMFERRIYGELKQAQHVYNKALKDVKDARMMLEKSKQRIVSVPAYIRYKVKQKPAVFFQSIGDE